jgi:HEAT repeat protein
MLGGAILIVLWRRTGRGRDRLVGFLDYVRNPDLRAHMGDHLDELDRAVADLAQRPADELVELLLDDDGHFHVARAVEAAGPRTVPALIAAIGDPRFRKKTDPRVLERMHAVERRSEPLVTVLDCLAKFGPPEALPAVAPLVSDANDEVRRRAALVVGSTGADEALDLLRVSCADEDSYVRSYACTGTLRAIAAGRAAESFRAGAFDAIEPLIELESFPSGNREAFQCLLRLDKTRAAELLTRPEHLAAERPGVSESLDALLQADVVIEPTLLISLAEELEHTANEYARKCVMPSVLLHLARAGSDAAMQVIERATHSPTAEVREGAAKALTLRAGLTDPFGPTLEQLNEQGWRSLTEPQRLALAPRMLIWEVENGGFAQYFVNSSGDHWPDALEGLAEIGAAATRDLLQQATDHFGPDGPSTDRDVRHRQLAQLMKKKDKAFRSIEDAFYKDEDDREVLLLRYIVKHAQDFKPAD